MKNINFYQILTGMMGFIVLGTSEVLAQAAATPPAGKGDWSPMIGIFLMIAVFYFLIILPQSRKAKKHAEFLGSLQKGDGVVTQTGLYGKIAGIADRVITLEIAPGVKVRVDRQTIAGKDEFAAAIPVEAKEKAAS